MIRLILALVLLSPLASAEPVDSAVRVLTHGRNGAGVLVDEGRAVITLRELVNVGRVVRVTLADGTERRGRIAATADDLGLALVLLTEPAPASLAAVPSTRMPERGEAVVLAGHGGAAQVPVWKPEVAALVRFSTVHAQVASDPVSMEEEGEFPAFLVDRLPGAGDLGAPVYDDFGALIGLLAEEVPDGGGRGLVVAGSVLAQLIAEPRRETPYALRSHFQTWSGLGMAVHDRPLHVAGSLVIGARVAILDGLRLEPFFEVDLGLRRPVGDPEPSPQSFWWSLETGLSVGYRIPIFNPRSRDYFVPVVGFRIGWNRFDHRDDALIADCSGDGGCRWTQDDTVIREESLRPGVDIGVDLRKGKVRIGYRFFLAPTMVQEHSMHRIFVTFDGFPLNLRFGDAN